MPSAECPLAPSDDSIYVLDDEPEWKRGAFCDAPPPLIIELRHLSDGKTRVVCWRVDGGPRDDSIYVLDDEPEWGRV